MTTYITYVTNFFQIRKGHVKVAWVDGKKLHKQAAFLLWNHLAKILKKIIFTNVSPWTINFSAKNKIIF